MKSLIGLVAIIAVCQGTLLGDDWSCFRGPNGQGRSEQTDCPVKWSEREGIAWKTAIPGRGWSSPVIEGNEIWLTTATDGGHSLRAICVDAQSGGIRHDVEVFAPVRPVHLNPKNSHASPSPIVERGRLYVHFGGMGTACLATQTGEVLWRNKDLVIDHQVGPGSSPIGFENLLIVNCDGIDRQYVVALDKKTGAIVWKTPRSIPLKPNAESSKASSTPALIEIGGQPEVISVGADQVEAYEPRTGHEVWRVHYSGFSNVPIPLVDRNRVYVVTDFSEPELWAIHADGHGDVTGTHVLWKVKRQVGASASPVLVNGTIFLVTDEGVVTCLDAETGKPIWHRRIGGTFSASPIALGGNVYFASEQGKVTIIRPADDGRIIAENQLDGRILATPALCGRTLIVRTDTDLYRIH